MGSVCDSLVKPGVLRGAEFAQGLALQLKPCISSVAACEAKSLEHTWHALMEH
jgi:hypothetical protein